MCVRAYAGVRCVFECVLVHVKGERWLAVAVKGEKKFGFSKEASCCPCLRLLIYGLVKEISHLSLFISSLPVVLFSLLNSPLIVFSLSSNILLRFHKRAKKQTC